MQKMEGSFGQKVLCQAKVWICAGPKGTNASRTFKVIILTQEDYQRSWRHVHQKVQERQAYIPWCYQVHSSCLSQALGKHAHALGTGA